MNIFILDNDPKKSVQYYVDKHIRKMTLETAQLLCSAHYFDNDSFMGKEIPNIPYKLAYQNHPCSKWVRKSLSNYMYLLEVGHHLIDEYRYRFNKEHKSFLVIEWALDNFPFLEDKGLTPFVKAMKGFDREDLDVVENYRYYYNEAKSHLFGWTKRDIPYWIDLRKVSC
jgi:hypothetical protein